MSKPLVFCLLLLFSVLTAGIFGMLHNQLSFSVGATYFHDYKFDQFGISDAARNRWGAAIVGWKASWWMGLLIGIPTFVAGLIFIQKPRTLMAAGIGAIMLVLILTLVTAMAGLLAGLLGASMVREMIVLPEGLNDPEGFIRAALMHEGSYLGGFLGLILAIWTVVRTGKLERRAQREAKHAA